MSILEREFMKRILSFFILICILLSSLVCFTSCGDDAVYSLGPYEITEKQYRYLASMFNRQTLVGAGIYGSAWDATVPSTGLTVAQTLDIKYTDSFTTNVMTLLFSQLLFDVLELEMPSEMIETIEKNVDTVVDYYGPYSEQRFDQNAKKVYGFTADTLREVYTMQMKQTLVVEHLFGANGDKIDDRELKAFYEKEYMNFNTIVINNAYKIVKETNDKGEEVDVFEELTESEVKERNDIIDDLTNLFIEPVEGYVYKVIDPTMSYEQLYARYSDDTAYPNGCYSKFPSIASGQNALAAAALLNENDIAKVVAKRSFAQGGKLTIGDKTVTINPGDYFEYGYVFVKRLPLDTDAYKNEAFAKFFTDFKSNLTVKLFGEYLANYEKNESGYTVEDHGLASDMPLSSITPNDIDYNLIYGDLAKKEESSSSTK